MIRLGPTIKVTDPTQYHDPQLALQTAAATYLLIRDTPSSLPVLSTQPSFLNDPSDDQNNGPQGLPKSVLEYIFLAVAVFVLICIILRRCLILRTGRGRLRQGTFQHSASHRCRNFLRPVELRPLHPDGQPYPTYPDSYLREIPAAYQSPSRRTRARDVDSGGRRQDIPSEDGGLGANDLPAYEYSGGPPKYFELDMSNRPPLSGITHRPDVGWDNINTSPENVGVHTPVGTVSQPDTSVTLPPYLENSSSNNSVPMTQHETYRD